MAAAAEEGVPPDQTLKAGYALKRSGGKGKPSKGDLLQKWDRRFFRLTQDKLAWWRTAEDAAINSSGAPSTPPKGAVLVSGGALLEDGDGKLTLVTLVSPAEVGRSGRAVRAKSASAATRDLSLDFGAEEALAGWRTALLGVGAVVCGKEEASRHILEQRAALEREGAALIIQSAARTKASRDSISAERAEYLAKREAVLRLQRNFRARQFQSNLHELVVSYSRLRDDPSVRQIRQRNNVIRELLSTEASYVQGLDNLVDAYLAPLQARVSTRKQLLDASEIAKIFKGVADIRAVHKKVLGMLREAWAKFPTVDIAQVFAQVTPFFKVYKVYVNNFDTGLAVLGKAKAKNTKLEQFLWAARSKCGMDLESLMITPIQRIPRYEMMLAELVKYTPENHVDRPGLVASSAQVKATAMAINEDKERFERREKVRVVMGTFDTRTLKNVRLEPLAPARSWVAEADMQVSLEFATKSRGAPRATTVVSSLQDCRLVLFSDIMVFRVANPHPKSAWLCLAYAQLKSCKLEVIRGSAEQRFSLRMRVIKNPSPKPLPDSVKPPKPASAMATVSALPGSQPGSFAEGGDGLDDFLSLLEATVASVSR